MRSASAKNILKSMVLQAFTTVVAESLQKKITVSQNVLIGKASTVC
jgi:hypothetical protein